MLKSAKPGFSALTKLYMMVVIGSGLAVLVAAILMFPGHEQVDPLAILLFVGLATLGESYAINLGKNRFLTRATIVHVCCILLFPPPIAASIAATGMALDQLLHHRPAHKLFFNSANNLVSVGVPGIVIWLLTNGRSPLSLAREMLPTDIALIASAGILYYVINTSILAGAFATIEKTSVVKVWLSNDCVFLQSELASATIGALAAIAWTVHPAFIVLLILPTILVHGAFESVRHAERSNELLDSTNQELQTALTKLNGTYDATLHALVRALDSRDTETENHSRRVVAYSQTIAEAMEVSPSGLEAICRGALLHDVGKIGVPDAILRKPGPLTDEEWQEMRRHCGLGYRMLAGIDFLEEANLMVLQHHERFDGKGYPLGLAGAQIDLGARIFAVADTIDAMTSDRPYRRALSWDKVIEELKRCAGTQFDPTVVHKALNLIPALRAIGQQAAEPSTDKAVPINSKVHVGGRSSSNGDAEGFLDTQAEPISSTGR